MTRYISTLAAALTLVLLANCAPNRSTIEDDSENPLSEGSGLNPFSNSNTGSNEPESLNSSTNNGTSTNTGSNTNSNTSSTTNLTQSQIETMINAMASQDRAVWTAALQNLGQVLQTLARKIDEVWTNLKDRMGVIEALNIGPRLTALEGGTKIPMYRCPSQGGGSLGGGEWGFYGCLGQIQSTPSCFTVEWPRQATNACTFIGNITVK